MSAPKLPEGLQAYAVGALRLVLANLKNDADIHAHALDELDRAAGGAYDPGMLIAALIGYAAASVADADGKARAIEFVEQELLRALA